MVLGIFYFILLKFLAMVFKMFKKMCRSVNEYTNLRINELKEQLNQQEKYITELSEKLTTKQQQINQTNAYWKNVLRKTKQNRLA